MRPTHRQIEAFRALMITGSMTEAARILSVTQPAVSKIISQLEEEIGFPVFIRKQGRLKPNDNAFMLYAEVEKSFSGLEQIARVAKRIQDQSGGNLRVAVMPTLATGFIAQLISRMYDEAPEDLHLSLQAHGSDEVANLVAAGLFDIGFATTPIDDTRVRMGPVLSVPTFCILPENHLLSEKERVSIEDLENERFIATAEGTPSRIRIDSLFSSLNVTRRIVADARWSLTIADLVQSGLGCSIVDGFTASTFRQRGGIVRPLREELNFPFTYLTRTEETNDSLAGKFLGMFRKEFEDFRCHLMEL